MKEIWKEFDRSYRGYAPKDGSERKSVTIWEASTHGNIRKIYMPKGEVKEVAQHLSGGHPNKRYLCLSNNRYKYVHRIIAELFVPNPENKPTVDHIDGDRQNNHVDNLRWATHSEQHYFSSELRAKINKKNKK